MLTQSEFDYLLERLGGFFVQTDARMVLGGLPRALGDQIAYYTYPGQYARAILEVCIANRWNDNPSWLSQVIILLPDEPETRAIRDRISKPPNLPDPSVAQVLVTGTPFLDRTGLRQRIRNLGQTPPARPILVVSGETKSGKSYSAEYIDHLAISGQPFVPFRVKFPRGSGRTYSPVGLARDILVNMGLAPDRLPVGFFENTTNNERFPYDLAGKVLAEGQQLGKRFWIVLDSFKGEEMQKETGKFIDGLAQRIIESAPLWQSFRLILIDFERSLLSIQPNRVDIDQIPVCGRSDVLDCVAEIFHRTGVPKSDEELEAVVARIMKDLPPAPNSLGELHQRLMDLLLETNPHG